MRIGPAPDVRAGHSLVVDATLRDTPDGPVLETTFSHPGGVLDGGTVARIADRWVEVLTGWAGEH